MPTAFARALATTLVVAGLPALPDSSLAQDEPLPWLAFHVDSLIAERVASGQRYLQFLDRPSMSAGLYTLEAGSTDRQRPHQRDEVYYIARGEARLEVEDESYEVETGSIVFVRAQAAHRFVDITEDLHVIVVFTNREPEEGPVWQGVSMSEVLEPRDGDNNVWNVFFDLPALVFGMYMMPERLGGDQTLTHRFDELNIVVNGSSMFRMGDDSIELRPGSIVFVEARVGHSFDTLDGDLDVLILWERRDS